MIVRYFLYDKNSTKFTRFLIEVTFFHSIVFQKSDVMLSELLSYQILYKGLKAFNWNIFRGYCGFGFYWSNYILSNFLKWLKQERWFWSNIQNYSNKWKFINAMYPNKISFLTYWFLKIKWLFAKSVKITKETAIHRSRFLQSF